MPLEPPRDLTIPEAGSTTARRVLSAAIRRLLGDLRALRLPVGVSPAAARGWRVLREVVADLLRRDAGAVASVLRRPTVGAPLRCLRDGSGGEADGLVRELVGQAFFELALGGALGREVVLEAPPPRLISLATGRVIDVPPSSRVALGPGVRVAVGERAIDLADASRMRRLHPIADDALLACVDNNPLAMFEAHPDKGGNAIDLGGRPVEDWTSALRDAFDRVGAHMPELRGEAALVLQAVVPVGWDAERHLSASYREAIGTVYLSLHPEPMTMTEALVHELSHNKLNALFELDPVVENEPDERYRSPVRPDPRPLHGVLLAVHAFLPIARLYEAMRAAGDPLARTPAFARRFAQIIETNHEGAELVLAHARPTPVGRGLLDEIERWDAHFQGEA